MLTMSGPELQTFFQKIMRANPECDPPIGVAIGRSIRKRGELIRYPAFHLGFSQDFCKSFPVAHADKGVTLNVSKSDIGTR